MTSSYTVDDDLIPGLVKGDEIAFDTLINMHGDHILRACYIILKDSSLAEDAVQETFIQIYKSIGGFNKKSSLYTWIYKIAVNKCRNIMRKSKDYTFIEEITLLSDENNVEDQILDLDFKKSIKDVILTLNPQYREVVFLYYYEEFSVNEISNILNESQNTVKSKLFRARRMLKEALEKEGMTK